MNPPLTADEKRVLLQLLYLDWQIRGQYYEDENVTKDTVFEEVPYPPTIPEDYETLLASGPYSLWHLASGGAYELAEELLANSGKTIKDGNVLTSMAIGAACRADVTAARRWIDLALEKLRNLSRLEDDDPQAFGWTYGLLVRCQLGLACQVIDDQVRKDLVRENINQFLQIVDAWVLQEGRTPFPDCAHELRILLDLKWYDEVRFVLRRLPIIYCFIASYNVNIRLMRSFLEHNMSEHIWTMIGASKDARARNGYREAAICAAIEFGDIACAWRLIQELESEEAEEDPYASGLEYLIQQSAEAGHLRHWKTILHWNDRMYHPTLNTLSVARFLVALSRYGDAATRKEVWERARLWSPPEGHQDPAKFHAELAPSKLLLAAFAGETAIVHQMLENENRELDVRQLYKLRKAAVLHDMAFVVDWAHLRLEGEGDHRMITTLELELERMQAGKPNEFRDHLDNCKQLVISDPKRHKLLGKELAFFIRSKLRDNDELIDFLTHFPVRWLLYHGSAATLKGDLTQLLTEILRLEENHAGDLLMDGIQKCLINRYGIQEKMDRFDSGRGI